MFPDVSKIVLSKEAQAIFEQYKENDAIELDHKNAALLYRYGLIDKMAVTYTQNGPNKVKLNETGKSLMIYQKYVKKERRSEFIWRLVTLIIAASALFIDILQILKIL